MFITNYHFTEILEWFNHSRFEFLIFFLPSCDTRDRKFDDYFIQNQSHINLLPGCNIAFFVYDHKKEGDPIENVTVLPPDAMRSQAILAKEISDYYSFAPNNLPALILISRAQHYTLYPVSSVTDLYSYFESFSIVTSYIDELITNDQELQILDHHRTHLIDERNHREEEIHHLEESDFNNLLLKVNQCLKKVHNYNDFLEQNANIWNRMEKLSRLCDEIYHLTRKNECISDRIHDIDSRSLRFEGERNTILSYYGQKLNDTINVTNGTDVLQIFHPYSSQGIIELLAIIKDKVTKKVPTLYNVNITL